MESLIRVLLGLRIRSLNCLSRFSINTWSSTKGFPGKVEVDLLAQSAAYFD